MAASSSAGPSTFAGLRVANYNVGAKQQDSYSGKKSKKKREELLRRVADDVQYLGDSLDAEVVLVEDLHDPYSNTALAHSQGRPKPDKNP